MLIPRRLVLAMVLSLSAIATATTPAHADGVIPVDCSKDPNNPQCTVQAGTPGRPASDASQTGSGPCRSPSGAVVPCTMPGYGVYGGDGCWYRPMTPAEVAQWGLIPAVPPASWQVGTCFSAAMVPVSTRFVQVTGPPSPAVLAVQAVKDLRLPLPAIRVNPATPAPQLVFLPTWLWLDGSSWVTRSATASVPGMSVTATARAAQLMFTTGDGAIVSCPGPGTAWAAGKDPNAASPDCGHTYTQPGTFTLTATVTWQISWAGGGQTGTVPNLTTTATLTLTVTESQALNTNT